MAIICFLFFFGIFFSSLWLLGFRFFCFRSCIRSRAASLAFLTKGRILNTDMNSDLISYLAHLPFVSFAVFFVFKLFAHLPR